jgi:hypothetical protein
MARTAIQPEHFPVESTRTLLSASQLLAIDIPVSLAPGFSRVISVANRANRFSGFLGG